MSIPAALQKPPGLCPIIWFNRTVGGRYKLWIIYELRQGPVRYGEIRRGLVDATREKTITARVLSRELKELQARGLISRKQYPVVPPKVEYRLTPAGQKLVPVIDTMVLWVFGKPVPPVPFPILRPDRSPRPARRAA